MNNQNYNITEVIEINIDFARETQEQRTQVQYVQSQSQMYLVGFHSDTLYPHAFESDKKKIYLKYF